MSRRKPSLLAFIATATVVPATLLRGFLLASQAQRQAHAPRREARVFLATITGLVQPLQTVANQAAWTAATDVTPEHTAARASAEKALASVSGSKLLIAKDEVILGREERPFAAVRPPK